MRVRPRKCRYANMVGPRDDGPRNLVHVRFELVSEALGNQRLERNVAGFPVTRELRNQARGQPSRAASARGSFEGSLMARVTEAVTRTISRLAMATRMATLFGKYS